MKIMITDRMLRAMKPAGAGTRKMIWDSAVPSFGVRVTDKGQVTFVIMRRLHGRLLRRTLGQYPVMSLAEGRAAALEALRDIARGIDPRERQAAQRHEEEQRRAHTFAAVAEEFIVRHVRKLRSGANMEAAIRRELIERWGARPGSDISRRDVVELIEEISDSGRLAAARKTFAHVSKFFSWAIARGIYGLDVSPCAGVKPGSLLGAAAARQRVLSESEIKSLWEATEGLGYPAAPFIRLLLLTGQRLREVAEMSWDEVDIEKGIWTIPASRMKGGIAHEVPLPQAAIGILKSLPRWTGPHVFSTTGGRRPISGFSKIKARLDAAMPGTEAWRFHDLRRTMRTGLGGLPVPSNVAELCIGHVQPGMHRVYDRHSYRDEKRRAFELWASRVEEIAEPGRTDNLVRLRIS